MNSLYRVLFLLGWNKITYEEVRSAEHNQLLLMILARRMGIPHQVADEGTECLLLIPVGPAPCSPLDRSPSALLMILVGAITVSEVR
jgi:hypothetical protein